VIRAQGPQRPQGAQGVESVRTHSSSAPKSTLALLAMSKPPKSGILVLGLHRNLATSGRVALVGLTFRTQTETEQHLRRGRSFQCNPLQHVHRPRTPMKTERQLRGPSSLSSRIRHRSGERVLAQAHLRHGLIWSLPSQALAETADNQVCGRAVAVFDGSLPGAIPLSPNLRIRMAV